MSTKGSDLFGSVFALFFLSCVACTAAEGFIRPLAGALYSSDEERITFLGGGEVGLYFGKGEVGEVSVDVMSAKFSESVYGYRATLSLVPIVANLRYHLILNKGIQSVYFGPCLGVTFYRASVSNIVALSEDMATYGASVGYRFYTAGMFDIDICYRLLLASSPEIRSGSTVFPSEIMDSHGVTLGVGIRF